MDFQQFRSDLAENFPGIFNGSDTIDSQELIDYLTGIFAKSAAYTDRWSYLSTSVSVSDEYNRETITEIIDCFLAQNMVVQICKRGQSTWERCELMPTNFDDYCYRVGTK
jgi:hypothetical protein